MPTVLLKAKHVKQQIVDTLRNVINEGPGRAAGELFSYEIIEELGLPDATVEAALAELEAEGRVVSDVGDYWTNDIVWRLA